MRSQTGRQKAWVEERQGASLRALFAQTHQQEVR
jgi:hypothetical protein